MGFRKHWALPDELDRCEMRSRFYWGMGAADLTCLDWREQWGDCLTHYLNNPCVLLAYAGSRERQLLSQAFSADSWELIWILTFLISSASSLISVWLCLVLSRSMLVVMVWALVVCSAPEGPGHLLHV